jgi:hypothetical protein
VKGREEVTFTILIQEIKEVGSISNLLICEPFMIDGSTRTSMESLAVVVATETIAPLLTMDVKVLLPKFSTRTTSINWRNSPSPRRTIKQTPATTSAR